MFRLNLARFLSIFIFFLLYTNIEIQANRVYGINDSTILRYNDSEFQINRWHINLVKNGLQTTIFDSREYLNDDSYYIGDFDIINENSFLVTVSSRYIGYGSRLYYSFNNGDSWELDTSYFDILRNNFNDLPKNISINQVQILKDSILTLFAGYYESGIIYSSDFGKSWSIWDKNTPSFYNGIFSCEENYYLFGFEGDGFSPIMQKIDKSAFLNSEITNCVLNNNISCIKGPNSVNQFEQFTFFKKHVDKNCTTTDITRLDNLELDIDYKNHIIDISKNIKSIHCNRFVIYNTSGNEVYSNNCIKENFIDISNYSTGIYFIIFSGTIFKKIILIN